MTLSSNIVIICGGFKTKVLDMCITAVEKYASFPHFVTLVDNSMDRRGQVQSIYDKWSSNSHIKVISGTDNLYLTACNLGRDAHPEVDVVVYMDDDVIVAPNCLEGLLRTHELFPDCGISVPLMNFPGDLIYWYQVAVYPELEGRLYTQEFDVTLDELESYYYNKLPKIDRQGYPISMIEYTCRAQRIYLQSDPEYDFGRGAARGNEALVLDMLAKGQYPYVVPTSYVFHQSLGGSRWDTRHGCNMNLAHEHFASKYPLYEKHSQNWYQGYTQVAKGSNPKREQARSNMEGRTPPYVIPNRSGFTL